MKWSKAYSIGESKLEAGETRDAIRYFKKALVIAQKNGSKQEEADTLERLGNVYRDIEHYHEAVDCFEKGLEIVKETGDKKLESEMCYRIGLACDKLGDYEKFMQYSKQGFNVALRIGDSRLTAHSYEGLGRAFCALCDYQKSITCHKKAIDVYKQLNNEEGLGVCYANMSLSYQMQGKYHDAIRLLEESLRISVNEIGRKEHQAIALLNLGTIYTKLNDIDKALEMFQKSLTISIDISNKGLQANCCVGLGNLLINYSNKYLKAIPFFQQCLDISIEIGDKQLQSVTLVNIGKCLTGLHRYEEANKHYDSSLAIAKELNDKGLEASIYYAMAENNIIRNQFQTALPLLEKCHDIASINGNTEIEGAACYGLGKIYYSLHKENQGHQACHDTDDNIAKSEQYLRKALDCFDFLFQHLHQRDLLKVSIFDKFNKAYKLLTTVLIETGRPQEALLVSDGGRARALGDRLMFKYGIIQKDMSLPKPLTYPDVEAIFFKDVFSILHYSLLSNSLAVWVLAKDSLMFRETEKEQFNSAIEILTQEKKDGDENSIKRFFTATVSRAYEMMKIQESVTCENRSLDDCVTSKDHVTTKASESLSRDDGTSEETLDKASHPLETLYNCLVGPVLSDVRHDEIVIVPDGPMYRVPFAALRDPNTGHYLSDTKRIRLAPSIAILKALNECPVDHHSQKGALIVGNPSVGEVMFRGKKRVFARLASAGTEVRVISYKLGQAALTGEQATKNAVLHKLREGSAVIHIAAHGSSDNGEIALAPNVSPERQGIPEEDDYLLTMREVQEIGIKAQLVVLSCCYSGRGEIRAEGMVGLSRAFLAAGARSVVASLWAIDDTITLCFMLKFYGYLTRGDSASVSLHKAMLDIRAEEGHRDPKYWAPFFLIGDDVTLNL
ncbi:tetratricopeptide repeat protein 28 isoform X1 [Exaiptasia diaphana]|uniref:CHAT domain-containing protein n=1 Tax=Exaiptasia diaphana TaxID=2652724 RepID=A0A913YPC1_EXADI|nr:tetratricopeptide repeat protein 28 isoform X1 [Exaiptasia diaphana]XP_028516026.1 tetratricopeptide repeat protein 28 isoform X1 [Exaiptasia diaphana]